MTSRRAPACALAALAPFALFACDGGLPTPACPTTTDVVTITWDGPPPCETRDSLPRPWVDLQRCELSVWLPEGVGCDAVGGRDLGLDAGRARCALERLVVTDRSAGAPPPDGLGWFYDDFTDDMPCPGAPSPNNIRLLPEPSPGTELTLACVTPDAPTGAPNAGCARLTEPCDPGLTCDPLRERCSAPCTDDAACEAAGLTGWICDRRPRSEIDLRSRDETPNDFCVNPTCEG
ncbi:MAG: hypothetical protein KF729_32445 [Sandaracinaceae bacterium]|nr:hypothetical protein [Sandaracinaceae bacterium]